MMSTCLPDPPRDAIGRMLNMAAGTTNALANRMLAEHGLTLAQWVALSALWRQDGLLVSQLAAYSGNNLPAASRLVDRMVDSGLVERRPEPEDRRVARVFLTGRGRELSRLSDFYKSINEVLVDGFSAAERQALMGFLERICANAGR